MTLRRAIYTPPRVLWWTPEPEAVEFISWEPNDMARILVPVSEKSIVAIYARQQGVQPPKSWERLVPAAHVRLVEVEA